MEEKRSEAQKIAKSVPKFKFYCLVFKGKEHGWFKGEKMGPWYLEDIHVFKEIIRYLK